MEGPQNGEQGSTETSWFGLAAEREGERDEGRKREEEGEGEEMCSGAGLCCARSLPQRDFAAAQALAGGGGHSFAAHI